MDVGHIHGGEILAVTAAGGEGVYSRLIVAAEAPVAVGRISLKPGNGNFIDIAAAVGACAGAFERLGKVDRIDLYTRLRFAVALP